MKSKTKPKTSPKPKAAVAAPAPEPGTPAAEACATAATIAADSAAASPLPQPGPQGRVIGLDCHPDTITAAVCSGSTPREMRQLQTKTCALDPLLAWVRRECGPEDLFLLEAGGNSFEIVRRLGRLGLRAVVLESAHVGQQAKRYADNDRLAAARIVRVYLAGDAPVVWVPDARSSERREVLHAHQRAVRDQTAASNALKGYLNQSAIRLGRRSLAVQATKAWVLEQRAWSPLQQEMLDVLFTQLAQARERRQHLVRLMAREIAAEPLMLRCLKLLGIGHISAFALLAIIGDIRRFAGPEKLVAYLGLNPGQRTSGTHKKVQLGVGRRGRSDLRHLLIQGAQAILRRGRDTALGKWGWQLFARKGHRHIAAAAVARKLAVQVWHALSGHPPLALEPDGSLALKLRKLAVTLGKQLRAELALPGQVAACARELYQRLLQPRLA